MRRLNVLVWHVHGSYTTALVHGRHRYLVPVLPNRGPWGGGRAETYEWPDNVVEVTPEQLAREPIDVMILQRPPELEGLAEAWSGGRRPGVDVPALYLEHNAPQGRVNEMRHPAADRPDLTVVHVTHFNRLFWDTGSTPTVVVEHGVVDPGLRYSGELPRLAAAINEPGRRARVVGADLVPYFADAAAPVDVFGIATENNLPQWRLHEEVPRRRVYLHPYRWTSLGLALIEAMQLGMPVVALATTEVPDAVPAAAGFVSNRLDVLVDGARGLLADAGRAHEMGLAAREHALARYGLERFLRDWDQVLAEAVA
jgi:hypothetical protein